MLRDHSVILGSVPRDGVVVRLGVNVGNVFTPPERVTSPTWGPPSPCKRDLRRENSNSFQPCEPIEKSDFHSKILSKFFMNKYSICVAVFNVYSLYLRDRKGCLPFHIETRLLCSYLRPETNVNHNKLELALKLLSKLFFIPQRHVNQKR